MSSEGSNPSLPAPDRPVTAALRRSGVKSALRACSSGDRALGCGPKGRRFESCQAYPERPPGVSRAVLLSAGCYASGSVIGTLLGGEVSEWLKVPLSKSGEVMSLRGFESHPLRHSGPPGRVA